MVAIWRCAGRTLRRRFTECLRERHEPTRGSLVEWVWGFLEEYPLLLTPRLGRRTRCTSETAI